MNIPATHPTHSTRTLTKHSGHGLGRDRLCCAQILVDGNLCPYIGEDLYLSWNYNFGCCSWDHNQAVFILCSLLWHGHLPRGVDRGDKNPSNAKKKCAARSHTITQEQQYFMDLNAAVVLELFLLLFSVVCFFSPNILPLGCT